MAQVTADETDAEARADCDAGPLGRVRAEAVFCVRRDRIHARLQSGHGSAASRPDLARQRGDFLFPGAVFRSALDIHRVLRLTALMYIASEVPLQPDSAPAPGGTAERDDYAAFFAAAGSLKSWSAFWRIRSSFGFTAARGAP